MSSPWSTTPLSKSNARSPRLGTTTTGSSDSQFATLEVLNDPTPPPIISLGSPFGVSLSPRGKSGIHTAGAFSPWRLSSSPLSSVAFQDSLRKSAKRPRDNVFTTYRSPCRSSPSAGLVATGTASMGLSYTQPYRSDSSHRGPDPEDFNRWAKRLRARIDQAIHPVNHASPRTVSRLSTGQPTLHSVSPLASRQETTLNGSNSTHTSTRTPVIRSVLPTGPGVHNQRHPATSTGNRSYSSTRSSTGPSTESHFVGYSSDKYVSSSPVRSDQSIIILSSGDEEVEDEKGQALVSATPSPISSFRASNVLVESGHSDEYTSSYTDIESQEGDEQQFYARNYEYDHDDTALMVESIAPSATSFGEEEQLSPGGVSYSISDATANDLADTVVSLSSDTSSVASSSSEFDSSGSLHETQSLEGTGDSTLVEREFSSSDSSALSHDFHGLVRSSSHEVSSQISSRTSSPDPQTGVGQDAVSAQLHVSLRPLLSLGAQPVSYHHTMTTALSPVGTTTSGHPLEQSGTYELFEVSQSSPVRTRRLSLTSVTSSSSRVSCHCNPVDHPDSAVHTHNTSPYFLRSQCRSKRCVLRDAPDKDPGTPKANGKHKTTNSPASSASRAHLPPSISPQLPLEGTVEWDSPPAINTRNKCHQRTVAAAVPKNNNTQQRKQHFSQQVNSVREPYELRSRSCSSTLPRPTIRDASVMPPPKFSLTVSYVNQSRPRALSSPTRSMGKTSASPTG
ncbi:hypothetical protein IWQ62_000064 [Dispira parvispora]|uniref:Uncharacterized protein n=1 Tax=Dispira parvispora TaxID=1520584 RepID=A0A9W8AZ47_9FUNG|nr:hypothetical protein IWQ62_000064 [Dispira parvispora]